MLEIIYYILIGLGIIVSSIILILLVIAIYLKLLSIIYKDAPYNHRVLRRTVQSFSKALVKLSRIKYVLTGAEKVPKDNFIFYGNHQALMDIFVLLYEFGDRDLGGVAKKEVAKIPIIKEWIELRGILPIDRSNARKGAETMIKVTNRAKKGQPMFIFPEGTRSRTGELLEFKPGAFKLAIKSKKDIYPFVITGFNDHKIYHIKRKKCEMKILDPIKYEEYSDMSSIEISNLVRSKIKENMR